MKRAAHQPAAAPDPRVAALLEVLVGEVRGLRAILESRLADLAASSNGRAVDVYDDDRGGGRTARDARDPAQLLTGAEVAALLQIDERTLRELRHSGEVPGPLSVGKRLRWRRRDVEAWMAKRKAG